MILYLIIFVVGGLLGWILDTIYRSLEAHRYAPGTLVPFFSVIFGIGAIFLYILFSFFHISVLADIVIGATICLLLELTCGAFSLIVFKHRFWDYRASRFNFRGLIDVEHSLYWLLLTILYRTVYPFIF